MIKITHFVNSHSSKSTHSGSHSSGSSGYGGKPSTSGSRLVVIIYYDKTIASFIILYLFMFSNCYIATTLYNLQKKKKMQRKRSYPRLSLLLLIWWLNQRLWCQNQHWLLSPRKKRSLMVSNASTDVYS